MKSFSKKFSNLREEAQNFIELQAKKHKRIVLAVTDEDADNFDEIYDLPFVSYVTKHSNYEEHAVLAVRFEKESIMLETRGKDNDEEQEFMLGEMYETEQVCFLADTIAEKLGIDISD